MTPEQIRISTERELGKRSLYRFVKMAWSVVNTKPFVDNWHLVLVCAHLEALYRGETRRLIINIPPGGTKSMLASVFFPAWCWIQNPGFSSLVASFDLGLTLRDADHMLKIVKSQWFTDRWGGEFTLPKKPASRYFTNSKGGFRFSTSVEGKGTGFHPDMLLIDDPTKAQDLSTKNLEQAVEWWRQALSTRGDPRTVRKCIIMQRLHEDDLVGYILKEEKHEGWVHLRLPMRYEASNPCETAWGRDPRTVEGELFFPERFPLAEINARELTLRAQGTAAQHQQRPSPAGGNVFKRNWFKTYAVVPVKFDSIIQSWDMAFKDAEGNDWVVGTVWGKVGADYYLLDRFREHVNVLGSAKGILDMRTKWPRARAVLIEDKANGPAVIQILRRQVSGIIAMPSTGSKVARAEAAAVFYESGNVFHPESSLCPWILEYEDELCAFPNGAHDDQVDCGAQALNYLYGRTSSYRSMNAGAERAGMLKTDS